MTQEFGVPYGTTEGGYVRARRRASRRAAESYAQVAGAAALGLLVLSACGTQLDGGGSATLAGSPGKATSPTPADVEIAPQPSGRTTPVAGKPWDGSVSAACEQELAEEGRTGLSEVAQTADAEGVTSFWVARRGWVACDGVTGDGAPAPTLIPQQRSGTGFDENGLALSATVVPGPDAPAGVRYTAAGLLPWPVDGIAYTFPDGHVEEARFVTSEDGSGSTWWSVSYTATEGVLADPDAEPTGLEPVTIEVVGAAAEAFRLPWQRVRRSE